MQSDKAKEVRRFLASKNGSIFKMLIRLLLFALALYILFLKWPSMDIANVLKEGMKHWLLMGLAFLIYYLKFLFLAIRWLITLAVFMHQMSLNNLIQRQMKIHFLDIITPIPNAEDIFRIMHMKKAGISVSSGVAIVAYDRFFSVLFLLFLLPGTLSIFSGISGASQLFVLIPITFIVLFLFLFRSFIFRYLVDFLSKFFEMPDTRIAKIESLLNKNVPTWAKVSLLAINLCKSLAGVVVIIVLASIWDVGLPFFKLFLATPLLYFSVVIPVSYQGLGLYEAALVIILIYFGVSEEIAVSIGLVHFIFNILSIGIGGIFFVLLRNERY